MKNIDETIRGIRTLGYQVEAMLEAIAIESEDADVSEAIEEANQNLVSILNGLQSELALMKL